MTMNRRTFSGYLLAGTLSGAAAGFVAGRYSKSEGEGEVIPLTPRQALRQLAVSAPGIHQIGLEVDSSQQGELEAEALLLKQLFGSETRLVYAVELQVALSDAVKRDYLEGRLVNIQDYVFSETEARFVRYALQVQGLEGVAYVPPKPEIHDGIIASGVKFGPKSTVVGQIFNEQPDGHGGLWVAAENTPPGTQILLNGSKIKTRWQTTALTGAVYDERLQAMIAKPSKHEIALFVPETGVRQVVGEFEVKSRPPAAVLESGGSSSVFCEIEEWSIKDRGRGETIVIETYCGPRSSTIYIGDVGLKTKVKRDTIEAAFDRSLLSAGEQSVRLVDTLTGEAVGLGLFPVD